MIDDRHRGLKRWEKARQIAGLEAEPDLVGPLAWCRVKSQTKPVTNFDLETSRIKVYIVRIFTKDLVCVHAYGEKMSPDQPGQTWLVRAGIEWDIYLREVAKHYQAGLPVAEPFYPRRKIAPDIVAKMLSLPKQDLPAVFSKLRETGILPSLPNLDRNSCPPGLIWDTLRANFQDFLDTSSLKDNQLP